MTETPNPHIVDTDTLTGEMRPIRRAVLALGSNLGERMASLQGAVNAIADTPDVWVTGVSPVYETEPVDSPPEAKNYLNAVVLVDTGRLSDSFLAVDYFERRGIPFVVAVNCFYGNAYHALEEVREALAIDADVPIFYTDARMNDATKNTLLQLVQHALTRAVS